ncbi:hypothetical protein [Streptomyces sp. 7N604]|uniref:hypothetical protein n=1 Tax=Streptomyces sp. 7N604 TaxID=3457415 RepID=UPI003FCFA2C2
MSTSTLESLRRSVDALLKATGQTQVELAAGIDLPHYAVSRRQSHSPWSFDEADRIAVHFGVPVLKLLAGPAEACEALANRLGYSLPELLANPSLATANSAPVAQNPATDEPLVPASQVAPVQEDSADEMEWLTQPEPCVLCGFPATTRLQGFVQHPTADDCQAARQASQPTPSASPASEAAPQPQDPPTESAARTRGVRRNRDTRPGRPRQERADTTAAGITFLHHNVRAALESHGGDIEAAQEYLLPKAIPHAVELLDITRRGGRYDVVAYPWLPEIFDKPTNDKADQIWEARPKWTRRRETLPPGTHTIDELDMNGAYLSALKTHLPLGEPEHTTGPIDTQKERRAGVHLVTPGEWVHEHLPNPIGARDEPGPLWITEPTLRLLKRLSTDKYHRLCAPPEIHESWTSGSTEHLFEYFRAALTQVREEAIASHDDLTLEYVKAMYSKFVSTLGHSNYQRDIIRPDWMHIIRSQAFSNLWGKAYKANEVGMHVVRVMGTDELHVIGDWRNVFNEGRAVTQVKLKDQHTITIGSEE